MKRRHARRGWDHLWLRLTRGLKHGLRYCWDGDPADWWEVEHYWYVLKLMRVE